MTNAAILADEIFALYDKHGEEAYAGEKVTQLEHMYQSAGLAAAEGCGDELILAAFLHDIGHLLPITEETAMTGTDGLNYGMVDHEKVGADWLLQKGFGENLCKLIASHVNAKRYLTWKYPAYYEELSEASKQTLIHQGGRMETAEALAFEADPLFPDYIRMRKWDEAAKVEGLPMTGLPDLRQRLLRYLQSIGH